MRISEVQEKELARAKNTAYRYLSYRPRSRAEVVAKLQDREFSEAVIQQVLTSLMRLGYIDDEQFADQWARSRVRLRGLGRRRIERELRGKGLSPDIIHGTLGRLFADSPEEDTARREAEKKLRSLARFAPEVQRRRLAGFLERKGFSSAIIHTILRDIHKHRLG